MTNFGLGSLALSNKLHVLRASPIKLPRKRRKGKKEKKRKEVRHGFWEDNVLKCNVGLFLRRVERVGEKGRKKLL